MRSTFDDRLNGAAESRMPDIPADDPEFYERMADELRHRLAKLEPAVREYERLRKLLDMVAEGPEAQAVQIDAHGTGPPPSTGAGRRRAGPRGYRASQVLSLLRSEPGLTRAEVADRLGIRVGYLYQLLPALRKKGYLQERDGSWFAT
jgi:CRP-like cAMP-binding protein